ncbi:uncharacterized [Tachysurus ichikawai]
MFRASLPHGEVMAVQNMKIMMVLHYYSPPPRDTTTGRENPSPTRCRVDGRVEVQACILLYPAVPWSWGHKAAGTREKNHSNPEHRWRCQVRPPRRRRERKRVEKEESSTSEGGDKENTDKTKAGKKETVLCVDLNAVK